jgi:hypothetical protein
VDKVRLIYGDIWNREKFDVEFRNPREDNSSMRAKGDMYEKLKSIVGRDPNDLDIAMLGGQIYMYRKDLDAWGELKIDTEDGWDFYDWYKKQLSTYKTGGLADFTGPAWLDGTPSRPEYVLNAAQTEKFFSLIDALEHYDTNSKNEKPSGDNYFDIEINVEKIEDDYDVEQIADKIRRMICEDATYRNVNAIKHIR